MSIPRPSERVTLTEIGRRCGYHPSTISLALRSHPSIPEATRKKIREKAKELGYRPDPALASLIAYRSSKRANHPGTAIAVISDGDESASAWRTEHPTYSEYWRGMVEQAEILGYSLSEFSVGRDRQFADRVNHILEARGVTAVVVAPMRNSQDPVKLNWNRLSAVAIGYSLTSPSLPRITHAHHFGAMIAVEKLFELGHRRIAMALPYHFDQRVHHGWSAGYLSACQSQPEMIDPLLFMPRGVYSLMDSPLSDWLKQEQPDAIITAEFQLLRFLQAIGYNVPQDLGYVFLDCEESRSEISGIVQNSREIGRQAVNIVSSSFINFTRGIPEHEASHLINGVWQEGTTVCDRSGKTRPALTTATA